MRFLKRIHPMNLLIMLFILLLSLNWIWRCRPQTVKQETTPFALGVLVVDAPDYLVKSLAVGQDVFQTRNNGYLGKICLLQASSEGLRLELRRQADVFVGASKYGVYFGHNVMRVGEEITGKTLYSGFCGQIEYLRRIGKKINEPR